MLFAKEINMLTQRLSVLTKTNALIDEIHRCVSDSFWFIGNASIEQERAENRAFEYFKINWSISHVETEPDMEGVSKSTIDTTITLLNVLQRSRTNADIAKWDKTGVQLYLTFKTQRINESITGSIDNNDLFRTLNEIHIEISVEPSNISIDEEQSYIILNDPDCVSDKHVSISEIEKFYYGILEAVDMFRNASGGEKYSSKYPFDKMADPERNTFEEPFCDEDDE